MRHAATTILLTPIHSDEAGYGEVVPTDHDRPTEIFDAPQLVLRVGSSGFFWKKFAYEDPAGKQLATGFEARPTGWRWMSWIGKKIFSDPAHHIDVAAADAPLFSLYQAPDRVYRLNSPVTVQTPTGLQLGTIAKASANPFSETIRIADSEDRPLAELVARDYGQFDVQDPNGITVASITNGFGSRAGVPINTVELQRHVSLTEPLRTLLTAAPIALRLRR